MVVAVEQVHRQLRAHDRRTVGVFQEPQPERALPGPPGGRHPAPDRGERRVRRLVRGAQQAGDPVVEGIAGPAGQPQRAGLRVLPDVQPTSTLPNSGNLTGDSREGSIPGRIFSILSLNYI